MKPLTDATLRVRDAIYRGLLVREGAELTEHVARERANNIATAVIETLIEGLTARLEAPEVADARALAVPGQDILAAPRPIGAGKTAETLEMRMAEMEADAAKIIT